jgi:hypothetical protein
MASPRRNITRNRSSSSTLPAKTVTGDLLLLRAARSCLFVFRHDASIPQQLDQQTLRKHG